MTGLEMSPISQELPETLRFTTATEEPVEMIASGMHQVQEWIEVRDYSGYEPYDILNSPLFCWRWLRESRASVVFLQIGKRWGGMGLRSCLRIPASKNPKALALVLAAYCDRMRLAESCGPQAEYLKRELRRLRSPREETFCWGYDWDYVSLRNTKLPAFSPHSIATVFCGQALLDFAELTEDEEAAHMASSAGQFIVSRLNRTVDTLDDLCFSYTPSDRGRIYNSAALAAAFLARLGAFQGFAQYRDLARRVMHYIVKQQLSGGAWFYGAGRMQKWIDSFHTGYILTALLEYQDITGDRSCEDSIRRGYSFYHRNFFDADGAPKYFHNKRYPIDIHCCSQAILTFCAFSKRDAGALQKAAEIARWTLRHMRGEDGAFYYQRHRLRVNHTAYMRWGQAWMFRALSRLHRLLAAATQRPQAVSL
jgi:hypothetical protein